MDLKNLTPEQLEKVHACATPEDYVELAKSEGIELTDEQLEAVAGGRWSDSTSCPECGGTSIGFDDYFHEYQCMDCGYSW